MLTDLLTSFVDIDRDVAVFVGVVITALIVALGNARAGLVVLVIATLVFRAPMVAAVPKVIDALPALTTVTTTVTDQSMGVRNRCERLTAEQVASLLYVAGFRGDDLVHLLAIGKRESGYKPAAHRSDKDKSLVIGDRGLFQINYIHDPRLKAAGIITTASDLFDPLVNARAAWFLFAEQGLFPWNMTAGGWQANGVPFHATNVDAARVAVERAGQQGLLTGDLAEYERQTAACATEVM